MHRGTRESRSRSVPCSSPGYGPTRQVPRAPHCILLDRDNRSGLVDLDGVPGQRTSIECVPRSSSDARYRRELLARDLFRQPFLRSLQDKRTGVLEASLPHPTLNDATDLCQIQATAPLSDADRYVCPRSANQKDPEGVSVVSELLKENTPAVTTSLGETPAPRGPLPSSKPSDLLANSHPAAVRSAAKRPFYRPVGDEVEVFRAAARRE
jgi:hypothetical protein